MKYLFFHLLPDLREWFVPSLSEGSLGLSRSKWVMTFFSPFKKIYSFIQSLSLSKLNKEKEILKETERNIYFQNLELDETKKQWIVHSSSTVFTAFLVSSNWIKVDMKHVKYHVGNELPVQVRCTMLDAWGWCTGTAKGDGVGREEGGGFGMGNTCVPVADSFWYLAKLIQLCKV